MKNIILTGLITIALLILLYLNLETTTGQNASITQDIYTLFRTKYGKNYAEQENIYRFKVFVESYKKMVEHNKKQEESWKMGINIFSDMTKEEFIGNYLGRMSLNKKGNEFDKSITVGDVDWVGKGAVTSVKQQGNCGSCWAFAATAAHQSYQILRNKKQIQIDLSQQQLVDCSTKIPYENLGCQGGYAIRGLEYIKDYGQVTQQSQPYQAGDLGWCRNWKGPFKVNGVSQITGCINLQNLLTSTPVAVAVDASNWSPYQSGIFSSCGLIDNHDVLLVGSSSTYWKIKNSWGPEWGEEGYIRLAKGNTCGVCAYPAFIF